MRSMRGETRRPAAHLHSHDELLERYAADLRLRVALEPLVRGVEMDAEPGAHAAGAAAALLGRRLGDEHVVEGGDPSRRVVGELLGAPGVDDEVDVVNRDRRLGHVGREYDLGDARVGLGPAENALLLVGR